MWWCVSQEPEESDPSSDISSQERHQGALQRLFYGRAKLLKEAVGIVKEAQLKGGLLLLEGAPGEGKSVFMVNYNTASVQIRHAHSLTPISLLFFFFLYINFTVLIFILMMHSVS